MRCPISLIRTTLLIPLLVWCCWAAASVRSPGTGPFAGWLDAQGTATVGDVREKADWEPFASWKGWAYGPEPVWLRVQVPAQMQEGAPPSVLIVRPPHLDRVTFFDPLLGVQRLAGDYLPATDDALGSVLFSFEIPARPQPREVFVKVESASARVIHMQLLPLPEARAYARSVEWLTGSVWLLSLVFWVWALVQWGLTRDRLMGIFAIKQGFITVWGFLFLGFARLLVGPLLDEGVLSLFSSMVVAGVVASSLWFLSVLLEDYQARPWMLRVLRVCSLAIGGMSLLTLAGHTQHALQMINTMAPPLLLWVVLTLLLAPRPHNNPPIGKPILATYLAGYGLLNSLPALMHVGLIQESFLLLVGNMSMLVLDGLVMLFILNVRQRRFREQHQAVATQLVVQQEQARLDRQYLDEQRRLLAMLAHEMKTPLANLRIWMEAGPQGRPAMERAIVDMDRVIERCVHAGQLSDHNLKPRHEWLDAAELTQNVLAASRQPSRVRLSMPTDVCAVHTDAQMLSIVLSNLLENAYKYSIGGTPISLSLTPYADTRGAPGWRWVVDNTVGEAGMPDARKVFDKYYRGANARRQSGSGLGLFLVKSLLELMQGTVTCLPMADRIRFSIWVPADAVADRSRME